MDQTQSQAEFQNPAPNELPIPQLPVYTDGLACSYRACPYVCRNRDGIIKHCESVHEWVNPYKRRRSGRSRQARDYPWQTGVHCQRLFIRGVPQEYFEVDLLPGANLDQDQSSLITPGSSIADKCQRELERIRVQQEAIASQEAVA